MVGENQVFKIIRGLGASKATDLDGIPTRLLKDGSVQLTSIIIHIIKLSIRSGKYPILEIIDQYQNVVSKI